MKTKVPIAVFSIALLLLGTAFSPDFFQPKPWIVPPKYVAMVNPQSAASIKEGKELWVQHCQSCHGKAGHGDGTKAATLKTEVGNLALPATQRQSDGSFFYKINEGRDDMPGFKKKIPDADDVWSIVAYMRTLK